MLRFQNARRKRFSSSCFKHCIRLKASRSLKTRQLHWLCHRRFMRHFKMRSRTFLFRICHVFFQRSSHVCYESLPRARAGRSVIEKSSHCPPLPKRVLTVWPGPYIFIVGKYCLTIEKKSRTTYFHPLKMRGPTVPHVQWRAGYSRRRRLKFKSTSDSGSCFFSSSFSYLGDLY